MTVSLAEQDSRFRGFKDLKLWQCAMTLVKNVYVATNSFPKEGLYGLTSQIRRCAVSVPSNVAEGSSKRSTREFIRFLNIAYGSLAELETQLLIAADLDYTTADKVAPLINEIEEIGRMTNGLLKKLNEKLNSELWTLDSHFMPKRTDIQSILIIGAGWA